MWGARGPFPPAAAMVVAVVMPVVFYAKATELKNAMKTLKLVFPNNNFINYYIVKHIVVHIPLIAALPEPKLYPVQSPNHFGPMDPGILGIAGKLLSL
jgi:hypothetical protein